MMTASDYPPAASDISTRRGASSLHHHHQQQQQHPQQPTRIKSFLRQNHQHARKILLPLLYLILSTLYIYNLLFHDVGSGVHVLQNTMDENITHHHDHDHASAPIWNAPKHHPALEPRSLADVTIANAEVSWKRRVDYETYLRKRAEIREVRRKALEESAARLKLLKERNNGTSPSSSSSLVDDGDDVDTTHAATEEEHDTNTNATATEEQLLLLKLFPPSNNSSETTEDYIKRLSSLSPRRIPKRVSSVASSSATTPPPSQSQEDLGLLPVLMMVTMCTIFRVLVSLLIGHFAEDNLDSPFGDLTDNENDETTAEGGDDDDDDDGTTTTNTTTNNNTARAYSRRRGTLSSFVTNLSTTTREAARLRRRARALHRHRQFQRFVDRLNAERTSNGEREISSDTLRHLMNGRDFNGNDYDNLSSFVEESGPAIGSIFSCIGATEAEIGRCPSRVLGGSDELLAPSRHQQQQHRQGGSGGGEAQTCSICLEQYQVGETVRTIPCFHTFHVGCIDPWLGQRAECPICKHSAIG